MYVCMYICMYLAPGDVCEDSEFQLAVVGYDESLALLGHKGVADLVLVLFKRRLVLRCMYVCMYEYMYVYLVT